MNDLEKKKRFSVFRLETVLCCACIVSVVFFVEGVVGWGVFPSFTRSTNKTLQKRSVALLTIYLPFSWAKTSLVIIYRKLLNLQEKTNR